LIFELIVLKRSEIQFAILLQVLNGVSKLREELEIERSRSNGLEQQVQCMKMKHNISDGEIFLSAIII